MQLLYRSIDTLQIGGYPFILRVMTDGDTVTVDFEQNPRSTAAVSSAEISAVRRAPLISAQEPAVR